ncbi:MAG: AAA family ATPase [Deltaproteobacteria bacterium]|nr:AAA family ATPase [Deltaproteobacteria bacterium]
MTLPALIASLLEPGAYPERTAEVRLVQTHISYVFMVADTVYKIKKPVDFGFLDFTTLALRRHFCEEEVRLNRRLAPDAYLGVVPITVEQGRAVVGGRGEPVEYAVRMRRIPDDDLLLSAIRRGAATPETIRRVAERIAAFHKTAASDGHISECGSIEVIRINASENFAQTAGFIGRLISPDGYAGIKAYAEGFLKENAPLFSRRVEGGFIRDCHGDIHTEHIAITDGIEIIDCVEFNERFRFSDMISDAAFLSMDLDYLGRHDLGRVFEEAYLLATDDREGAPLVGFYKCYRAYVRAKVAGLKSMEEEVGGEERRAAGIDAMRHFRLASLYAHGGYRPLLVIICGLPGAGKTTLAKAVSEAAGMPVVSSDLVRKGLAGIRPDEDRGFGYGQGIYTEEWTAKTYQTIVEQAKAYLRQGRPVIMDASFARRRYLDAALGAAAVAGADACVIECRASDETVMRNMARRKTGTSVSDAGYEVYLRHKSGFEAITEPHIAVNAEEPLELNLQAALEGIFKV